MVLMSSSVRPLPYDAFPDEAPAGLRTSLRNVPLLPAPSNVDDLIARLDSEDVPLSSRPLAALISDARAPDLEPLAPDLYGYEEPDPDSFFAPLALAANTNVAVAAPLRNRTATALRRLAGAALLVGACLITASPMLPPNTQPRIPAEPVIAVPEIATTAVSVPTELMPQAMILIPLPSLPEPLAPIEAVAAPLPAMAIDSPAAPVEPLEALATEETESSPTEAELESPMNAELPEDETDDSLAELDDDVPLPPTRPVNRATVAFAGQWGTSAKACRPEAQKAGALLAYINGNRGRAGNTTCTFKSIEQRGNTWKIAAVCSNGRTSWKSNVRLSLNNGRLTWAGRKGRTTYVRCQGA
jgi:hypothetical protein